jgi:hypothetical protein
LFFLFCTAREDPYQEKNVSWACPYAIGGEPLIYILGWRALFGEN